MRQVLELRHFHDMTLEQAGEILGVTRERVRQIETKALAKLGGQSRVALIRAFYEGRGARKGKGGKVANP